MSTSTLRQILAVTVCLALVLSCGIAQLQAQSLGPLTFTVTTSATQVEVGDTITVEGIITKEGEPAGLGIPRYTLKIETSPGVLQDEAQPIFEPARPAAIAYPNSQPGGATFTLTAVRAGSVTFEMSVNGEIGFISPDGIAGTTFVTFTERSDDVDVVTGPVQIPEPLTITLFGAGLAGIAGYARRRRK